MKRTMIGFAFLFCAGVPLSAADELSLPQAVERARAMNPEVVAARQTWEAAKSRVSQAGSLPDPEVGVEYFGVRRSSLDLNAAPEKWYDVAQTIPFPGKLRLRAHAAHQGAAREDQNYRTMLREVDTNVKTAYYELLYARRAQEAADETVAVLRRYEKTAEADYASGRMAQADVLRASIDLAKAEQAAIENRRRAETGLARINVLLNREPDGPLVPTDEPDFAPLAYDRDRLEALALENRPEVLAAGRHVSHAKAELAAARADYLPDTMVQYTWREFAGGEKDSVAMFKFNLPFVWYKRQKAMVDAARSERAHSEATLANARNLARYEVREAYSRVATSRRLAELYRDQVLPQSGQVARLAEAGYKAGKASFRDMLDAEREALEFRMESYEALRDYGGSQAALERAVGVDLFVNKPEERHE